MPDEMLMPADVARLFKVSCQSVLRWTRAGRLKSVKVGLQHRYRVEDVKAALEKGLKLAPK